MVTRSMKPFFRRALFVCVFGLTAFLTLVVHADTRSPLETARVWAASLSERTLTTADYIALPKDYRSAYYKTLTLPARMRLWREHLTNVVNRYGAEFSAEQTAFLRGMIAEVDSALASNPDRLAQTEEFCKKIPSLFPKREHRRLFQLSGLGHAVDPKPSVLATALTLNLKVLTTLNAYPKLCVFDCYNTGFCECWEYDFGQTGFCPSDSAGNHCFSRDDCGCLWQEPHECNRQCYCGTQMPFYPCLTGPDPERPTSLGR